MVSRHFYCPSSTRIIDEVTTNCLTCTSLKQLPEGLFTESTVKTPVFGQDFSADIIRINGQKILLCREKLSQFTTTKLLQDETANSIRTALIALIVEFMPSSGACIQVDCATSFLSLSNECSTKGSTLRSLNIQIVLGRTVNKNKNPIAENAIREFHKERLRLDPAGGYISETQLAIITRNMNSRIRHRGLSAKEITFKRDQLTNIPKDIAQDAQLAEEQFKNRVSKHNKNPSESATKYSVGDNVFLRNGKDKTRGREMYKITDIYVKAREPWAKLQKVETQFR